MSDQRRTELRLGQFAANGWAATGIVLAIIGSIFFGGMLIGWNMANMDGEPDFHWNQE